MRELYDLFLKHPRISTDTRCIAADSIFFALHGERFDGNRFAAEALEKGAAYAVVDDPKALTHPRILPVENTLTALQDLARTHRRALKGTRILVISGSNGKTTTKELVSRVLAAKYKVQATQGNLNNHIGVPLTLLGLTRDTEFGIVEMGASACGEIALLASVAQPDYGILTNIGRAHLGGFGGEEGVRRGKGELFDYLARNNGLAFIRREDTVLTDMAAERNLAAEYYSERLADGIRSNLEGDYNRFNIAAAVAVGHYFAIPEEDIRRAIEEYTPDNNRSQRTRTARNTLVVDCYNANPSSMRASIENFLTEPLDDLRGRALILGDMLELGRWSQEEHTRIIHLAAQSDARLYLVGPEFEEAFRQLAGKLPGAAGIRTFGSCRAFCEAIAADNPFADQLILLKGSRGIGLEQALPLL